MQKSNILVFEPDLRGHRLEYIHHLYLGAIENNEKLFFILPPSFNDVKDKFDWPINDNVKLIPMNQDEAEGCFSRKLVKSTIAKYKVINKYSTLYKAKDVFLIMLMQYIPVILLFLFKNIKFSGIIYRIYLYEWKDNSTKKKIIETLKWGLVSNLRQITKAFILNDSSSVACLNKIYHTNKYEYLPDPFSKIEYKAKDIREKLGIDSNKKVFLHFGGLTKRKGTLDIINSLSYLSQEEIDKYTFIFAGICYDDIKSEFYKKYEELKDKVNILVFDEFCSYEFLNDLCFSCDYILIPYYNTTQSSGIISYSAYYRKPVIGPKKGMLGKLIRKFKLGIYTDNSPIAIYHSLDRDTSTVGELYASTHTVASFYNIIFNR